MLLYPFLDVRVEDRAATIAQSSDTLCLDFLEL